MYSTYRDARADKYKLKLVYFNGRGRAEHVRLLLAAGGRDYEDARIEHKDWAEFKAKTPFGTLPVLEADGHLISSGPAIGRMVSKICGLAGENYLDQALVDSFVDASLDIRETIISYLTELQKNPDNKETDKAAVMEKVTPLLKNLEKALLGDKQFFVGDKLSYADIQFYAAMEFVFLGMQQCNFLDDYPQLKGLNSRVGEIPAIAKHLKDRPQTSF